MIVSSFVKIYAFYVQIFLCTCSGILCPIALIPISLDPSPTSKKKLKFHSTVNGKSVPVGKVLDEGPGVGGGGVITKMLGPSRSQLK